ncbi:MAG: hypothetical protein FJ044_01735, partial [Candidatus Cloacimonetes bacterium]|nr:hypothetical protein [Candidatus Cloacimonadota bacterium]
MPRIIEKIKKIKKFLSQKIVLVIFLLTLVCLLIGGGFYLLRREKPAGEEKFISPPTPSLKTEEKKIDLGDGITLEKIDSTYKTVTAKPTGFFETGQEADLLLSGVDFDNSGGPLLFNHPGNIASDGKHLLLADRNNNRVLIWNKLPESNTPPDLVLGQENFITNNPGTSLSELNWPVGVATDGTHVLVADTYNDRILIWSKFPTKNGQAADLELKSTSAERHERGAIVWPWAVWTNGEKVIVTSTGASRVLIWNKFPTKNNEVPDVVLALTGKFGTPRSIASDGNCLMIGDHNALSGNQGNFFWKTFPVSDNQLYDFFLSN